MLALLLAAAASAAQPQPLKHFGDWVAGCDNGLTCRAVGFQLEGEEDFYSLSVTRAGGANASPVVKLEVDGVVAAVGDGRRVPLRFTRDYDLAAADVPALLALMTAARELEFVDQRGNTVARISPNGASAALRWMDDRQRRAGTITALVAKGPKAAATVPESPQLPLIRIAAKSTRPPAKLTDSQIKQIQDRHDCNPADFQKSEVHRLDASTTLALIPCLMGAYQGSSVAMLVANDGKARAPQFAPELARTDVPDEPAYARYIIVEAEFEPKDLSLWSMYKGRGLGDCGGLEAWAWDGTRFRLIYQNLMDECRGSRDRITIWRTANHADE